MTSTTRTSSAARPGRVGRRPRRHSGERLCADPSCSTRLSAYNAREYCYTHWPTRYPRLRGVDTEAAGT